MSEMKHTPEPCLEAIGDILAVCGINHTERIVACVNALAGIEDPEAWVREAKAALEDAGISLAVFKLTDGERPYEEIGDPLREAFTKAHDAVWGRAEFNEDRRRPNRTKAMSERPTSLLIADLVRLKDEAVAIMAEDSAKIAQLASALEGLQIVRGCWCQMAVGNPMYKDHTDACKQAQRALAPVGQKP